MIPRILSVPVALLLLLWLGLPGATPVSGQASPSPARVGDGTVAEAQTGDANSDIAGAEAPDPAALQMGLTQASARVASLEDDLRKHRDPVIGAYGLARMGAMVCEADPTLATELFRQAVQRTRAIPGDRFQTEIQLLPVASFTGLWNQMTASMDECQEGLSGQLVTNTYRAAADRRILTERTQANQWVAQARGYIAGLRQRTSPPPGAKDRPERAAQLIEGALTAGNIQMLDWAQLGLALSELRERAPPLVDALFYQALARISGDQQPSTAALLELGKFLFLATQQMRRKPDELYQYAQDASGPGFAYVRRSAYPHHVRAYIDAVIQVAAARQSRYWQRSEALSLLQQMQKIAYQMDLDVFDDLQKVLVELGLPPSPNPDPGLLSSDLQRARKVDDILGAIRANRNDQAVNLIGGVGATDLQTQLTALNEFGRSKASDGQGDPRGALRIANGLPRGLKRTLAYAAVIHAAGNDVGLAGNALSLGIESIGPLPAEFQAVGLAALAQALLPTDPNRALTLVGDLVDTVNDTHRNSQRARLDNQDQRGPARNFEGRGTDAPEVLLSQSGPKELIWSGLVQHEFSLTPPGVDAFSLPALMRSAVRALPNPGQLAQLDAILVDLDLDADLLEARMALLDALLR